MTTDKEAFRNLTNKIHEVALYGLDIAKKENLDEAKIGTSCAFEKKLVVENKQFSTASTSDVQSFGVAVHQNQKKGSASINTLDKSGLAQAIKDATDLASFSVADPHLCFAKKEQAHEASSLDFLYDEAMHDIELEEIQEFMQTILETFNKDTRIAIDRFEAGTNASAHGLYNTHGVTQREKQTLIDWSWMGMAVDGDQVSGIDYEYGCSFSHKGYQDTAVKQAEQFSERLVSLLNPGKCPTYNGPVLLSPRAVQSILVGTILFHASGRSVMDGKSRWQEKVSSKVISDQLTIVDDPHAQDLVGATSFDGDGLPTSKRTIIDKGVLVDHLCDLYSAKRLARKPTATSGGPFGLRIAAGDKPLSDLFNARKELLVVDRFSGNNDPIKGDFSGVAKSSSLYIDGKRSGAVKETMIAGNFFEISDRILGVSKELFTMNCSYQCPWVLVDGVSVTG